MVGMFFVNMLLPQTKSITVDCGNIIFLKWSFNHLLIAYSSMRDILHITVTKFNSSKIDTVDSFVRNLIFAPGSLGKYPLSKKYIWLPFISVGVKRNKLLIFSRQVFIICFSRHFTNYCQVLWCMSHILSVGHYHALLPRGKQGGGGNVNSNYFYLCKVLIF